ncbi:MAG: 4-azaleucine resistance transporter AzlC [Gammaproteobacteria bacterium]|jgi:4-azaleucine resistance transporter AzlC
MSDKTTSVSITIPGTIFLTGMRDTLPLIVAAIPFGIVYGALAISQGLSEWLTMSMSLFVFAGASQFIAVTLLASSAAFPVILLTVFIVNLRHMLYATTFMRQVGHLPQWLRMPMAFWLTDETFAVASNRVLREPDAPGFTWYYLGSCIAMYSNWILCTWIGLTLGQQIPDMTSWGLDVAMVVAFVGIVVPLLQYRAHWACAFTAVVAAALTYHWPHQTGLLFSSLLAIGVGLLLESSNAKVVTHD